MKYISSIPGKNDALPFPRRVALMGCTGSIGTSTLRVLDAWRDSGRFEVRALAAGRNIALLAKQAEDWRPPCLAVLGKGRSFRRGCPRRPASFRLQTGNSLGPGRLCRSCSP